jgi:hypothetical protein
MCSRCAIFLQRWIGFKEDFSECVLDQAPAIEALEYYKKLQEINPPGEVSRTEERFIPTLYRWKSGYVLVW